MSAYRFCRTDDIGLLVDALNRCWVPHFPGEPPMTAAVFKRSIRDLQVWCSSCMVAFADSGPIGVLIGAKRPAATLVQRIAVHPEHLRQGHARHLLASLSSKLSILGPPRIVAEVPETLAPASALFRACGYRDEATLTDYVLPASRQDAAPDMRGLLLIPVSVDDLAANALLTETDRPVCWSRSAETLAARKDEIAGLAVASDERIEAFLLYARTGSDASEILALRSYIDDGGERLSALIAGVRARVGGTFTFPKVHPSEMSEALLQKLGFSPGLRHRLYSATPG